ncbi:GNAT family N-acetyltransferase [Vibrio sp. HDW18]|uniref:GNAT family N-acetyltransferase n=1 Tax=Vibrio sp. HDW18 TaxID=2714948 RepID=UPI00140CFFAB|nr:GNAT family N-acetyltransferase [Vibrio sp. HDW18]QIL85302.1 GNAT family N-acetyltransferase [Vibrio sp. HDW18]
MLEFQQFDPSKLPLIKRFYKMYYPATKPKRDESIIVGLDKTEIIAVVRFRTVGSSRLLTGMAVKTEQRQQTIGQQLLRYCQIEWLDQTTFCFAYSHLVDFYQHGGFTPVEPSALPTELETLYQRYLQSGKDLIPMQYQDKLCQE